MSVFGVAITDETLRRMPKYKGKQITQQDRAKEAMKMIQVQNKNINALNYTLALNQEYGGEASALCLIYNATGRRLELQSDQCRNWNGSKDYKEKTPSSFENGQWIAFVHAQSPGFSGSEGARVFRGAIYDGEVRDYLVSWSVPNTGSSNSAYTKVTAKDKQTPDEVEHLLKKARKISVDETDLHCKSSVSIGGNTSSEFVAILEHKPLPLD